MKEVLRQAIEGLRDAHSRTKAAFAPTDEGRQLALTVALDAAVPLLQGFSYLLGHCRGLDRPFLKNVPENYDFLLENAKTAAALENLGQELDALWTRNGEWLGFQVYDELIEAICGVIKTTTALHMKRAAERGLTVGLCMG